MAKNFLPAVKVAFPVASVWFGAVVGPSMVSGAFAIVYFAPYGAWGIIFPMLAMAIAAVVIGMGANIARRFQAYEYNEYSRKLYGHFSKVLSPILEIYMLIAMCVGGSAVIAMSSVFLKDLFGLPELAGAITMAIVCIVLVLWGDVLVRYASSVMSVVMIAGLIILAVLIISQRSETMAEIIGEWYVPEDANVKSGTAGAFALGLSNCCNALTLSSVEQKVKKSGECAAIGILSFIMSSMAFILSTLMVLPYCPEALTDTIPVLNIIKQYLITDVPWLHLVYVITMILALISSGVPQLHAVASRLDKIYPQKWKSKIRKNALSGVFYFAVCIVVSFLGLQTIINYGYSFLGYAAIPLLAVPICIIWPIRWKKEKKKYNKNDFEAERVS